MLPAFDAPRKSIAWAKECINESDRTLRAFFERVKTVEMTEVDPKTGHKHLKIKLTEDVPVEIERKAFEAIQHTRNSFDQSLFAACVAIGKAPRKDIHYPWRTSPDDLERTFEHVKCRIPVELRDVLRRQEPYGRSQAYAGGNDLVREMARIANQKHTVGISVTGFAHGGRMPDVSGEVGFLQMPTPSWDPVKKEMTLISYSGNPEIKHNYRLTFGVVFDEAAPLEGQPILPVLDGFVTKAEAVLKDLEAEAIKIKAHSS